MAGLRDILARFRPVATPGAPGIKGVPVDRAAERTRELEPVFALLADSEDEAAMIRQRAVDEGERIRANARRHADALVAEARQRVEGLRAEAAASARTSADAEKARAEQAAAEVVEQVHRRVEARLPAYVARAVGQARAAVDLLGDEAVRA